MTERISFRLTGKVVSVTKNFRESGLLRDSVQMIEKASGDLVLVRTNRGRELDSFIGEQISAPAVIQLSGKASLMLVITDYGEIRPIGKPSNQAA